MAYNKEQTNKLMISARYWLLGRKYFMALDALEYAAKFHNGSRKDGITPEFEHQLVIFHYVRTMADSLLYPEETFATIFLHDVPEDFDVEFSEISSRFGSTVSESTRLVTKKHKGIIVPYEVYFPQIASNPIASVVKGGDRVHNIRTMVGVFSLPKQKTYIGEVHQYFFPMLKEARRLFPQQEPVYQNIKLVLQTSCELYAAMHAMEKT